MTQESTNTITLAEVYDRVQAIARKAHQLVESGDPGEALKVVRDIQANTTHQVLRFPVGGLLIDIGSATGDLALIQEGIATCEQVLDEIGKEDRNCAALNYNIATGYGELHQLKRLDNPEYGLFDESAEARKAKEKYRAALKSPPSESEQHARLLTNAGNCFDSLGRGIDALELYDKALTLEPSFGMALANKGLALDYYSEVVGEHRGMYLLEAFQLLSRGLDAGVESTTEPIFRQARERIRAQFTDQSVLEQPVELSEWDVQADTDFEAAYIEFCLENGLYLNFCNQCCKCEAALGDPVHLRSMVVDMSEMDPRDPVGSDPFLRLSSYLNQIKQDYIAARFLLVQSQYTGQQIGFVNKYVFLIDPLDYSEHSIHIELLKSAFRGFFDVLDKVGAFINSYLHLGIKESSTYFSKETLWYEKNSIRPQIAHTNNHSLNALFDMFLDLRPKGALQHIRNTRNAMTHRFVSVRMIEANEDAENMTQETLYQRTIELARLVRNAIIYLLSFVQIEEKQKAEGSNGVLMPIDAYPLRRPIDED